MLGGLTLPSITCRTLGGRRRKRARRYYSSGPRPFAAAWRGTEALLEARAVAPEALAGLADPARGPWLAVGDGALAFRQHLEPAAVDVPAEGSALHRVSAQAVCELALTASPVDRDALIPDYVRLPDAELMRRTRESP